MISVEEIHVVLPAFNEATALPEVIRDIRFAGFENILIVDDGSKDMTSEVAKSMKVHSLKHPINMGAGAAVQTGLELAKSKNWKYVALMDADGQHQPEDILLLKQKMEETGCDIVVGSRFMAKENDMPRIRQFYNFLANRLTNLFAARNYSDSQSGLRLLNRQAIETIELEINGFGFCSEMLIKAERRGLSVEEIPTSVIYTAYSLRKGQDFQVGLSTAFHFLWNTLFKS